MCETPKSSQPINRNIPTSISLPTVGTRDQVCCLQQAQKYPQPLERRAGISPLPPTSTPPPGSREAAWNRSQGSRSGWAGTRLVCLGEIPASLPAKIRKQATVPWHLPLAGDKSLALSAAKGWHFDCCLPAPSHGSTLLSAGLLGGKTPACHQLPLLCAPSLSSPQNSTNRRKPSMA